MSLPFSPGGRGRRFVRGVVGAALPLVLGFAGLGCSTKPDCRHASHQCADGFACLRTGGGWECVPRPPDVVGTVVPAPCGAAEAGADPPPAPEAAPGGAPEPYAGPVALAGSGPCMRHRFCSPTATNCLCDDQGRILWQEIDSDGDGTRDDRWDYRYDGTTIAGVDIDRGADGTVDLRQHYRYGDDGFLSERIVDLPATPGDDRSVRYRYDEAHEVVETEERDLPSDRVVRRCVYDPPCPSNRPFEACGAPRCTRP